MKSMILTSRGGELHKRFSIERKNGWGMRGYHWGIPVCSLHHVKRSNCHLGKKRKTEIILHRGGVVGAKKRPTTAEENMRFGER